MFKKSNSLESQLSDARKRLNKALKRLAPKHKGGEMEEYYAAKVEVLRLEREVAKSRNEPYAVPFDFPVRWDAGAPLPHVVCSDYRTFLTFYVRDLDPNWDGSYVNVVDPSSNGAVSLCLVTFNHCVSVKFGHPNDEVQHGHPLYGKGLDSFTAQIVKNSPWLAGVAKTNSVHDYDRPEAWELVNHYVFWFHDNTFECLAKSFDVETSRESMGELLTRIQGKLLE